jgi:hypothetical protein
MFEKKLAGQALVVADEGDRHPSMSETDSHGVSWEHHGYILEVRPQGGAPFRVEAKCKVPTFSSPQPGDMVNVLYAPKGHKTEMVIEGDPRYDPKIKREQRKQQKQQQATDFKALLQGANPEDLPSAGADSELQDLIDLEHQGFVDGHEMEEARWKVPDKCPECGAPVDQSVASVAKHPICPFCEKPLPCQPLG